MAYTYPELHGKTVDELREIAKGLEHEAVKGYTQMNKEHLLPALAKALGVDIHVHHTVVGVDKASIKAEIRRLKGDRAKALAGHDDAEFRRVLRRIHNLKRKIRAATV